MTQKDLGTPTRWQRVISLGGLVAAGFTTLCCLGVAAALSLASSIGATFLTRDSALRPVLIATLAVTTLGSALTFWRHRNSPVPLLLTIVASVWIYTLVFALSSADHAMHDEMADTHPAGGHVHHFSEGRQVLIWMGLVILVLAQVWDLLRTRRGKTMARHADI